MSQDQNVNDVIQTALNQIMLTMKPRNTQESGDILCHTMTKMVEILAVIGGRDQAGRVLEELSRHVSGCKLPEVEMMPSSKAAHTVAGTKTVN